MEITATRTQTDITCMQSEGTHTFGILYTKDSGSLYLIGAESWLAPKVLSRQTIDEMN